VAVPDGDDEVLSEPVLEAELEELELVEVEGDEENERVPLEELERDDVEVALADPVAVGVELPVLDAVPLNVEAEEPEEKRNS
jgi:hypothetical protein